MADSPGTIPKNGASCAIPQLQADAAQPLSLTTSDGILHAGRIWKGQQGLPVVIYLHGIEGHSRWFETTARVLCQRGLSVYAPDRRGAGESTQRRGDGPGFARLVKDVEEMVARIAALEPDSPLFLVGNCWGGKLAVCAAAGAAETDLCGLILTSPAVATQVDVSFVTKLKIAVNYLFGGGRAYFDIPLSGRHFTDNAPYLQYVEADPLRLRQATARFFVESLKLTLSCRRASKRLKAPVLLLQSGRDAIVDRAAIERWFEGIGSVDKTLKIFTSAAHSLDFEPDQAEYQGVMVQWIQGRAEQARSQVTQ